MTEMAQKREQWWNWLMVLSLPAMLIIAILGFVLARTETPARALQFAPLAELPPFAQNTFPETQQAYRFAAANPDLLRYFPCYCGCVAMGHKNNRDCYIKESRADQAIVFDEHAANCGVCVEITTDVMRLWEKGEEIEAIYAYIVATYSRRGPSTEESL